MTNARISLKPLNEYKAKMYVVSIDGKEAGTIMKSNNTRTERFPWQATVFTGKTLMAHQPDGFVYDIEFLGSFWGKSGKADAIAAIEERI